MPIKKQAISKRFFVCQDVRLCVLSFLNSYEHISLFLSHTHSLTPIRVNAHFHFISSLSLSLSLSLKNLFVTFGTLLHSSLSLLKTLNSMSLPLSWLVVHCFNVDSSLYSQRFIELKRSCIPRYLCLDFWFWKKNGLWFFFLWCEQAWTH